MDTLAMIQVDYSQPAIWLGLGLIGGGLSLYQLRRIQPVLSKDSDIVVSSVLIFSGGILVFQVRFVLVRQRKSIRYTSYVIAS